MSSAIIAVIPPDRSAGERHLYNLLKAGILDLSAEVAIVFVGDIWSRSPTADWCRIKLKQKGGHCLYIPHAQLATAYNKAASIISSNNIIFLDCRLPLTVTTTQLIALEQTASDVLPCFLRHKVFDSKGYPSLPPQALLYPWLLENELVYTNDFRFSKDQLSELGGMDESPILGVYCNWDLLIRALSLYQPMLLGEVDHEPADHKDTPSAFGNMLPIDLTRRYLLHPRRQQEFGPTDAPQSVKALLSSSFFKDTPTDDQRTLISLFESNFPSRSLDIERHLTDARERTAGIRPEEETGGPIEIVAPSKAIRIAITGSFWEYHHNWLCFYNYLHLLAGSGFATYKILLDSTVAEADLINVDILIISRGKVSAVRDLVAMAKRKKIKTMYMIDDNWLTVGRDWPDLYGTMFAPGSEYYETFKFCLENCDCTLTYSPILAEDIRPLARKIVHLPNSVDINRFEEVPRPNTSQRFLVGYAGSPRFSSEPFEALAAVGNSQDIDILIFGNLHPDHESIINKCNIIRRPLMEYRSYIKEIRGLAPDILLAPLDTSRTSRSKCPNKYLEITAAGAVGIYTNTEPYSHYVQDGLNGRMVSPDAAAAEWQTAIVSLLNRKLLMEISESARAAVREKYSVEAVAPQFESLVIQVLSGLI